MVAEGYSASEGKGAKRPAEWLLHPNEDNVH